MSINIWLAFGIGVLWATWAYFMGVYLGRQRSREVVKQLTDDLRVTNLQFDSAMEDWRRDEAAVDAVRALCNERDSDHADYLQRIENGTLITLDRFTGPAQVNVADVRAAIDAAHGVTL